MEEPRKHYGNVMLCLSEAPGQSARELPLSCHNSCAGCSVVTNQVLGIEESSCTSREGPPG